MARRRFVRVLRKFLSTLLFDCLFQVAIDQFLVLVPPRNLFSISPALSDSSTTITKIAARSSDAFHTIQLELSMFDTNLLRFVVTPAESNMEAMIGFAPLSIDRTAINQYHKVGFYFYLNTGAIWSEPSGVYKHGPGIPHGTYVSTGLNGVKGGEPWVFELDRECGTFSVQPHDRRPSTALFVGLPRVPLLFPTLLFGGLSSQLTVRLV